MDQLSGLFEEVAAGKLTLEAACARIDASAVLHYGDMSRDAGVIYTPIAVARSICRRAIGSYLSRGHSLQNIRVFDSSCGTGIFLEAALEELYRLRVGQNDSDKSEYQIKKEIIENNLYGMDVDGYSIDAAATRLKLLLGGLPVKVNLSCDNALFTSGSSLYDIIVGNPPYMRVKSMSSGPKTDIPGQVRSSRFYRFQKGNLNLYKLFIERNLAFLKDGGSMGLIIPSSFLNESSSEMLRKHLFDICSLEEIIEIPERSRIFPGVNQATVIVVLNKTRNGPGKFRLRTGISIDSLDCGDGSISIGYEDLANFTDGRMEVPLLSDPSLEWGMIKRLEDIPPFKGAFGVPSVGEITVGNVDETFDKEYISEEPADDIFVKGIHLKEYVVDLSPEGMQPRWVRKEEFLKKRPAVASVIDRPRIIGRNTQNKACSRRLKFAMLPPGYLCSNSIKQIVITDKKIDPYYLLALLNSSTLNWHFELFCSQNNIRNYRIEALPIVRAADRVQGAFARVAHEIIASKGAEREFLDRQLMDAMAFELYFGDPGLIDAVNGGADNDKLKRLIAAIAQDERYSVVTNATYRSPERKIYFKGKES